MYLPGLLDVAGRTYTEIVDDITGEKINHDLQCRLIIISIEQVRKEFLVKKIPLVSSETFSRLGQLALIVPIRAGSRLFFYAFLRCL